MGVTGRLEAVHREQMPFHVLEGSFFPHGHAEIGGLLSRKWGFPMNLGGTIKRHHFFASYSDLEDLGREATALCCPVVLGVSA
ncbi:MAG TPA: hypothetical protein DCP92_20965 [Nitrospiraceae bacterium]|jgi:HD-like signal output (HDOD) protein|nr:hypothetical protein [Nitrospiraceae bacterium]